MRRLLAAAAGALFAVAPAHADTEVAALPLMLAAPPVRLAPAAPAYRVQPPELFVPHDAKPGAVSRTIRPFGAWTLICDDDLGARRRVCIASQTVVDEAGRLAFGWSLAGSGDGVPVLILRAPAQQAAQQALHLSFAAAPDEARDVLLDHCSATLCVGYLPVDPAINRAIRAGASVVVAAGTTGPVTTTLAGLSAAIGSIR